MLELLSSEYAIIQELGLKTIDNCMLNVKCRGVFREIGGLEKIVDFIGNKVHTFVHTYVRTYVPKCACVCVCVCVCMCVGACVSVCVCVHALSTHIRTCTYIRSYCTYNVHRWYTHLYMYNITVCTLICTTPGPVRICIILCTTPGLC